MIYDVAILGGGVVGCAILNKLTRIGKKAILIEKNSDVATETTKANSGIVHAGFDAKPNSLKAILNVRGAKIFPKLCEELKVPFVNNGALVIGNDMSKVQELFDRGVKNGVEGLEILNREQLLKKLPNISDNITCGLFAKTSAIVFPYELAIAYAEESVINGATVVFNYETTSFANNGTYYTLSNGKSEINAKKIVVACSGNHNNVAEVLGTTKYDIKYRRGEYYLLDVGSLDLNGYTIFPLPSKDSKGVLVSPTVSGNIIVGPTSILSDNNSPVTTSYGLDEIKNRANSMLTNIDLKKTIRVFAGVRTLVGDDFVIERDKNNSDIINVTGICSPGLTACPAIAEEVVKLLEFEDKQVEIKNREDFPKIKYLPTNKLDELIKQDSRFGKIVCRCETVSEAEIIHAINSPLKPMSIDGIKRRTRAGMGRCQGGFCFSKVMELIAKERNISIDEVIKENQNSRIIVGDIR